MSYLVQPRSSQHAAVVDVMSEAPETSLAASGLVVMECLVGPFRDHDERLRETYERAFARMTLIPLTRSVFERAARLRAEHRVKTPDAIHLAAALEGECDEIWTNDDRLSRAAGSFARVVGR